MFSITQSLWMREKVFLYAARDRSSIVKDQSEILTTYFRGNQVPEINEVILGGEGWVDLNARTSRCLQVLPLSGSIQVVINQHVSVSVHSGESARIALPEDSHVKISSTSIEAANALTWFVSRPAAPAQITEFEVDTHMDELLEIHSSPVVRIGQFHGRARGSIQANENNVIVFAVEGAFEVEGRLIERRDPLIFHGKRDLTFESLSDLAIMLAIEC
jgi:hypothetical protein